MLRVRPQSVLKGAGSFFLPSLRSSHTVGGTFDARYCYNLFLRHYSHARLFLNGDMPRVVAELGPGSSLGTGLATLLAGAEQYIALDLEEHRNTAHDLDILDQLCELFRAQASADDEPFPPPESREFPPELAARAASNLAPDRLRSIRTDLIERKGGYVRYVAP